MKIEADVSLLADNSLRIASTAEYLCCAENLEDVHRARQFARDRQLPLRILGAGSNVLLCEYLHGLILRPLFGGLEILGEEGDALYLRVAAGESWAPLVEHCMRERWYGLENLALIPGNAGAAPVQNVGAYGVEIVERLLALEVLDLDSGEELLLHPQDCGFGYRNSFFRNQWCDRMLICALHLRLSRKPCLCLDYPVLREALERKGCVAPRPEDIYTSVCRLRHRLPDPAELPNVGSFFRNPEIEAGHFRDLQKKHPQIRAFVQPDGCYRIAAGWLLEQSGWRGQVREKVRTHARHALVLINRGAASPADVIAYAAEMQESVCRRFGISLEIEPRVF